MEEKLPRHIAIIPDGNRRWAKQKGLSFWRGHQEGVERVKELGNAMLDFGIPYFSLWALSVDNIKNRPKKEIDFLLKILNKYLRELKKKKEIHEKKVRINILGFWQKFLPKKTQQLIKEVMELTKNYNKSFFNIFLAYNGTDEILNAINQIKEQIIKNPNLKISSELVKENLLTKDLPPVDFLIRTGGEPHLSAGFMMWDIANAQLYFTDTYFPDFNKKELHKALEEYQKRERRMGG